MNHELRCGESRKSILLIVSLLIFLALFSPPVFSQSTSEQLALQAILARRGYVKIGLESRTAAVEVASTGGKIVGPNGDAKTYSGPVRVRASGGVVTATAGSSVVATGGSVTVIPEGGSFSVGGKSYRGRAFCIARGGSVQFINELLIDDWLKGVLPAEIGRDALPEALKAQAVTARSEAIFRLKKPPHASEGYDFCTGVHCQAYKGMAAETEESNRVCDATLGVALLDGDGEVVNGVYHNVCGGVTAAAEDVWAGNTVPGLTPVFDRTPTGVPALASDAAARAFVNDAGESCFCWPGNPGYANYAKKYFRWEKSFTAIELAKRCGVGKVKSIAVTERRDSGRVRKLTVVGDGGTKTTEKELPIRNLLDLWSGLFVLEVAEAGGYVTSVTFRGAGNGHGVGLCQHGAREIARRGGRFEQILKHYYPTATVRKIYRP